LELNLVDNRDDLDPSIESFIKIRNRLRLDALGGVYNQQSSLTSSNASAHLVAEVHMAWSVNKVEQVVKTIFRVVVDHGGCLSNDSNASVSLYL